MDDEKFEYGILYKSGNWLILTDDDDVEAIYPIAERIKQAQFEGQQVFERKVKVIEDWVKID